MAVLLLVGGVGATVWTVTRAGNGATPNSSNAANRAVQTNTAQEAVTGDQVVGAAVTIPPQAVARSTGSLASPREGASAVLAPDGSVILLGGLGRSPATSTEVRRLKDGRDTLIGHLPMALHDTAAVALGGSVYLFGGGNTTERDSILRINPVTGTVTPAGRLPSPSSDLAGAVIGDTAYLVGGYDGTRWSDAILAWRPGQSARVVAHLPHAVRYAAVTATAGRVVIAGGSTPSGAALDTVETYDPSTKRVTMIGHLPRATTHAAAAELNGVVYLVGGRGATPGTPTRRIVAIDPTRGTIRSAGNLPHALSDLTAVSVAGHIILAGGKDANAPTAFLGDLNLATTARRGVTPPRASAPAIRDVYAATRAGMLSPAVRGVPERIYVPNSQSSSVDVIDPATKRIVGHYRVGKLPQHVTPSWDLATLWVNSNQGNSLTPFNPRTGKPAGPPVPVEDPYNLYFTPTGSDAIVVAERLNRLDFRDPHTMALRTSMAMPCKGPNHMDFTADGRQALTACEFSGNLVVWDVPRKKVLKTITVPHTGSMPQDVKLSPDGTVFYVADMMAGGVWIIDASTFTVIGKIPTGAGAHGLYPSRDATHLYVSNRDEGTVSLIDFATRAVTATWRIPHGSPDMGGVSADGTTLWLSGRRGSEIYGIDTRTGALKARIRVGAGPHGLAIWPQPGRYSLGHTGILR